jgi:hypothetical protein
VDGERSMKRDERRKMDGERSMKRDERRKMDGERSMKRVDMDEEKYIEMEKVRWTERDE